MLTNSACGFLILDRKGEYIKDTADQRGNIVYGLQNHPVANRRMVVVSKRHEFEKMKEQGLIHAYIDPTFSIRDIEPIDLIDFLPGITEPQADLVRSYAHIDRFYDKLLAESRFGEPDHRTWYTDFPRLYPRNKEGKQLLKKFEQQAAGTDRIELTDDQIDQLHDHSLSGKADVLERVADRVRRFCLNPFFGGIASGRAILQVQSCVDAIVEHLEQGRLVRSEE